MGLVSFKSGGGVITAGYKPSSIINLSITRLQKTAALTWTDPEDFTVDDTPCTWARTVLIRKAGSAPQSIHDGTEVAVITERNKHTKTPYTDSISEIDIMYYYAVYSVSTDGVVSNLSNIVSIMVPTAKTMTVILDLNDSNPETCGYYVDDAVGMPSGKTEEAISAWQEFFGYKPCYFKNGKVVGYLNPNDYTKFENGDPVDITDRRDGDVMVEFPRRGIKINKSGKIITVSMTEDPDNPEFTYYAHTRGDNRKDYFYLGAYPAWLEQDSHTLYLKSISGVSHYTQMFLDECRDSAHNNGSGYEQMTWFQWIYIQVMYILEFRGNLNSQKALGIGNSFTYTTGDLNTKGLLYGLEYEVYGEYEPVKLFGLEYIYNEESETILEGLFITKDKRILTATDNFNDELTGYTDQQIKLEFPLDGGYISDVVASSELGFLPMEYNGSDSTYFCDFMHILPDDDDRNCFLCTGYYYYAEEYASGIFTVSYRYADNRTSDTLIARLSYY